MNLIAVVASIVIALGILNVWFVRFRRSTRFRGGAASDMKEEFAVYGLPAWSVWLVGGTKVLLAALLVVGVWEPALRMPAAAGMAVLMLGAVAMHLKVRDPSRKAVPALTMLALSLIVAVA
jgi:hypothetical protein